MHTYTTTMREGTNCGPVDWSHPTAVGMPPEWREAEQNPEAFILDMGWNGTEVYGLHMYDGWPYWTPRPAILHASPVGGASWSFFDSYGIHPGTLRRRTSTPAS